MHFSSSWVQWSLFGHSSCILLGFIIVFFLLLFFFFDVKNLLRIILQETFVVEDAIAYSDCTNNSIENIIDVPSNVKNSTYEFSATGWKYGNVSPYTNMLLQSSISLSKPTSLSLKVIENSSNGLSFNIGKSGNNWIYLSIENGGLIYNGNRLKAPVMGAEYTVKVFSDKIEIYENDTLLYTDNITLTEWYVALGTGTNRYVRIKDFKIKAL